MDISDYLKQEHELEVLARDIVNFVSTELAIEPSDIYEEVDAEDCIVWFAEADEDFGGKIDAMDEEWYGDLIRLVDGLL